MALTQKRMTQNYGRIPERFQLLVDGGSKIFEGAFVALNALGYAVPGAASTSLTAIGCSKQLADNTSGSDGDISCLVQAGVFKFANSASSDEITIAELGKPCYIVDDQTVAKTNGSSTRSVAGIVVAVDTDGVRVLVSPETSAVAAAYAAAAASLPVQKRTVTVGHADLTDADTSQVVNIGAALPANARIVAREIRLGTAFSGGSVSAITVDIGGTDADGIVDGADVFTGAPAAQAGTDGINPYGLLGGQQLTATFVSVDDDLVNLTAGSVVIDVLFVVLA